MSLDLQLATRPPTRLTATHPTHYHRATVRAATYARKSTDDSDKTHDARSTTHQRAQCLALIEKNGWTLAEGHEYTDEATSGAVFNRPGLLRLMDAVKSKGRPFDVLVMYAEDRLGRDVIETGYLAKQIIDSGVRIFFADGTERKLGSATDALLMSISNYGAAFERERASIRVRDKLFSKARSGHATGSRAFGYDSVKVDGHSELRVNPAQAETVRWIFDLCQEGFGIRRIAHRLNEQPGVRQRRWGATGVRDLLSNEIYVGQVIYGRTRNEVRQGVKRKVAVPEAEWVRVERPELRIVPQPLWDAAHARLAATFATYKQQPDGRVSGRPERSALASQYLLAGMLRCGVCGGKLISLKQRGRQAGKFYLYYVCWRSQSRGATVCSNRRMVPMERLHGMVTWALQKDVLTPARIEQVIRDLARSDERAPERAAEARRALEVSLKRVETRLANLTAAVAEGGEIATLVKAIKAAEHEHQNITDRLKYADGLQKAAEAWDVSAYREKVEALVEDWQEALEAAPQIARQILRRLLVTDITVTPFQDAAGGRGFTFEAQGSLILSLAGFLGVDGAESELFTFRRMRVPPFDQVDAELAALVRAQWQNGDLSLGSVSYNQGVPVSQI